MKGIDSGTIMYNTVFIALGKSKHISHLIDLYDKMKQDGPLPDIFTYNILISSFGKAGRVDEAVKIFEELENSDCKPDIVSYNSLINCLGILARLNHQISPIGKPFEMAAFYFKEALTLLVNSIISNINPQLTQNVSPFSLIYKIGAYKSFFEISPFVQFANFTCNQALLESLNGYDHIHIIDFDIGYGGQWSSLMQELALRSNGISSLKITAFASPLTHDQLELGLARENLIHFANEINVGFDFEIVNIDVVRI